MKYVAIALWCLALLLGGSSRVGLGADLLLAIVSIPIILYSALTLFASGVDRRQATPLYVMVAIMALVFIQLVPLPAGLLDLLSARSLVDGVLQSAGIAEGWQTISAAPDATIFAAAALLPPFAMFLLIAQLGQAERRLVVLAASIAAAVTVGFAMLQVSSDSVLNATPNDANRGFAVGLFANKNHFTALIYCMLPLSIAWLSDARRSGRNTSAPVLAVGLSVVLVMLAALNLSNSRAGAVLAGLSVLLSTVMVLSEFGAGVLRSRRAMIVAGVLGLIGVLALAGAVLLVRDRGATDEARQQMRARTIAMIAEQTGRASGFGTFVPVYMAREDIGDIGPTYINHAHNDWLELVLEGGVAVLLVELGFLVWWGWRTYRIWSAGPGGEFGALGKAASIAIPLLMVHSFLDYPLRTAALLVTFAACCGLMCRIQAAPQRNPRRRVRREEA